MDSPSAANGDWLVYRYRSNGRVSIDGVIDGYEVKTTAVVQIVEQGDTGCSGCFYVNLGPLGLFAQKCRVVFLEGEANDYVTTDGEPLLSVWTRY